MNSKPIKKIIYFPFGEHPLCDVIQSAQGIKFTSSAPPHAISFQKVAFPRLIFLPERHNGIPAAC